MIANEKLDTVQFYSCCGKSICGGCVHSVFWRIHSFEMSGNGEKCPFCISESWDKTPEEKVERLMKQVEANVLVPFVHGQLSSPRN